MKPSNRSFDPKGFLDEVLYLLDEQSLRYAIDEKISRAAAEFRLPSPNHPPYDIHSFLDLISAYITHIYLKGLIPARVLTSIQARKEAISLLNNLYVSRAGRGFESAYMDCLSSGEFGVDVILIQLTESMKNQMRSQRIQSVLTTHIISLDWKEKRGIVEACLNLFKADLPEEILKGPPERFISQCSTLVLLVAETKHNLGSHLGGS